MQNIESIKTELLNNHKDSGLTKFELNKDITINIYPNSLNEFENGILFIAKLGKSKFLFVISNSPNKIFDKFDGEDIHESELGENIKIKKCSLNHANVIIIQELYEYTKPITLGLSNSFGFGDRIGLANPGHLKALKGKHLKPILAQQSIRELTRTHRSAEEVMDAAVWAALQEGYKDGFGADADHLKTTDDIDMMAKAGYKFFTFDPGDHVNNDVEDMDQIDIMKAVLELDWSKLNDTSSNLLKRYETRSFKITNDFIISPSLNEILQAILKYGNAFIHIKNMYEYLKTNYSNIGFEVEISVDETYTVTTPFEHFFFVNELKRLGVDFISLAPRFIGGFEKGIDYKGDIEVFKREYTKHALIAEHFGNYKLSIHSGSDKFKVYEAIASIGKGFIHVKTAGTSYLEALKVIAKHDPELFRNVLEFSKGIYEEQKKTYHVSADLTKVKPAGDYSDDELIELFNNDDTRQILHVAYGKVLTEKKSDNKYMFRDEIYKCLNENEDTHYDYLIAHFNRHLNPLETYVS